MAKKTLEANRRQTYEMLYEARELMETIIKKASKEKYIDPLKDIKDRLEYSVTNDEKYKSKQFKTFVSNLRSLYKLLNHEFWNKRRIKKRIKHLVEELDKIGIY